MSDDLEDDNPWRFVKTAWFQWLTAVIVFLNVLLMVVEAETPSTVATLFWPDQLLLCFYVCELFCKANYYHTRLFGPPHRTAAWNLLDFTVVGVGVLEQWFLPFLFGRNPADHSAWYKYVMGILWLFRICRTLKLIRILTETDLTWAEGPAFETFVAVVIIANALMMGLETDIAWPGWTFVEQLLLGIYLFELGVNLKTEGCHFLSAVHPDIIWNMLDFVIVVGSVVDTWAGPLLNLAVQSILGDGGGGNGDKDGISVGGVMMLIRIVRILKILRLIKLVRSVRPLHNLATGILAALQGVMWVVVLTFVVLYGLSIITTRLIGHGMIFDKGQLDEAVLQPFGSVTDSMFTLFRLMAGASSEAEDHAINTLMVTMPPLKFAFIFFFVMSSWTLLSILTAVVGENMIHTQEDWAEEVKIALAESDRKDHITRLDELFKEMDTNANETISERELDFFLKTKQNSDRTESACRMPVRDVKDVLCTLHLYHNSEVTQEEFIDRLVDASVAPTEKSVMRIEAHLASMQRKTIELVEGIQRKMQHTNKTIAESITATVRERIEEQSVQLDQRHDEHAETAEKMMSSILHRIEQEELNMHGQRQQEHAAIAEKITVVLTDLAHKEQAQRLDIQDKITDTISKAVCERIDQQEKRMIAQRRCDEGQFFSMILGRFANQERSVRSLDELVRKALKLEVPEAVLAAGPFPAGTSVRDVPAAGVDDLSKVLTPSGAGRPVRPVPVQRDDGGVTERSLPVTDTSAVGTDCAPSDQHATAHTIDTIRGTGTSVDTGTASSFDGSSRCEGTPSTPSAAEHTLCYAADGPSQGEGCEVAETARRIFAIAGHPYAERQFLKSSPGGASSSRAAVEPEPEAELDASFGGSAFYLEVQGGARLREPRAIARFLAREFGLLGSSAMEAAQIEQLTEMAADTKRAYRKAVQAAGADERRAVATHWLASELPRRCRLAECCAVQAVAGDHWSGESQAEPQAPPFLVGHRLSLADVVWHELLGTGEQNVFDDAGATRAAYWPLERLRTAMESANAAIPEARPEG